MGCTHQSTPLQICRYDPIANCKAHSQNIVLCDIDATGEHKLLVAGVDRKLRVYAGACRLRRTAMRWCSCCSVTCGYLWVSCVGNTKWEDMFHQAHSNSRSTFCWTTQSRCACTLQIRVSPTRRRLPWLVEAMCSSTVTCVPTSSSPSRLCQCVLDVCRESQSHSRVRHRSRMKSPMCGKSLLLVAFRCVSWLLPFLACQT